MISASKKTLEREFDGRLPHFTRSGCCGFWHPERRLLRHKHRVERQFDAEALFTGAKRLTKHGELRRPADA